MASFEKDEFAGLIKRDLRYVLPLLTIFSFGLYNQRFFAASQSLINPCI